MPANCSITLLLMKEKILNVLLIVSSLFGYLEWGGNQKAFLYESEFEVVRKLFSDPMSVLHPLILLPLLGQLLLLTAIFMSKSGKISSLTGIACLSVLLGMMFFIGLLDLHIKILLSTLPFLVIASYTVYHYITKAGRKPMLD